MLHVREHGQETFRDVHVSVNPNLSFLLFQCLVLQGIVGLWEFCMSSSLLICVTYSWHSLLYSLLHVPSEEHNSAFI